MFNTKTKAGRKNVKNLAVIGTGLVAVVVYLHPVLFAIAACGAVYLKISRKA